ncbi:MAG TPA: multicopper oxidase domain-containing protein [Acidimicrobiales bacterium]|nr:multicopper oxidase domain-containing protein [Acidimicrobiales bacterium]
MTATVAHPVAASRRGPQGNVPPADVPLGLLGAAAVGLATFGISVALAADRVVVGPTLPGVVSATHAGVLLFLSTAVLGAVHQFAPVVAGRPLRSVLAGRVVLVAFPVGAAVLSGGFAHGPAALVPVGGAVTTAAILVAAWNLSGPLSARGRGVPVAGLRLSVTALVLTAGLGMTFALAREAGWFGMLPHRTLAHAHLGLLGWMGLTYVAVAEKLWPMFLLAHRDRARLGGVAVTLLATGVAVLTPGLLLDQPAVATVGGALAAVGLLAHLGSLASVIRHRRRPLELLHGFILTSAAFLVLALVLAPVAAWADVGPDIRARLAAAEVAALVWWLALAVVGHAHRIVPFIAWGIVRRRGVVTGPDGRPLLFGHLVRPGLGRATLATLAAAGVAVVGGVLVDSAAPVAAGGALGVGTAGLAVTNLGLGPRRVERAVSSSLSSPTSPGGTMPPDTPTTDTPTTDPRPVSRSGEGGWSVLVAAVAVLGLILGAVGVGIAINGRDGEIVAAAEGAAAATSEPLVVEVELGDLYVEPAVIEVEAGRPLVLEVTNVGAMPHDLALDGGPGTPMLEPGGSATLEVGALTATTEAWCTVPGHREGGMTATIVVEGGEAAGGASQAVPTAAPGDDGSATIDPNGAWDAEFVPFDPALAPAPGGTEHEITLRATETQMEVAPGVTQEVWTFDDQVPGPILRGTVGDLFTVTLVNEGEIGHSIDFHASKVAWNDEMRTIGPGEELVYQFRAEHAGIFMYHCGTAPALHHIGNGMFGAIVIDPPDLPDVDREYVFVQSEWYLGPDGEPGSLGKMQDDAWDAVVFNGRWNQYAHAPIRVETGERIRAWVLDAGPSENSSFHIVGTIFDTVFFEGAYLLRPDEGRGGAQALALQPAQGGFVEFTFAEDGLYPIVTHKFSNVGKGALGLFQSGEVELGDAAAH